MEDGKTPERGSVSPASPQAKEDGGSKVEDGKTRSAALRAAAARKHRFSCDPCVLWLRSCLCSGLGFRVSLG
ncbi:MAG: hypothetical protein P4N59_04750, partial [Negativicutes bacterium]|nr:hypothetical protein [Negativicutes bacterium]